MSKGSYYLCYPVHVQKFNENWDLRLPDYFTGRGSII